MYCYNIVKMFCGNKCILKREKKGIKKIAIPNPMSNMQGPPCSSGVLEIPKMT